MCTPGCLLIFSLHFYDQLSLPCFSLTPKSQAVSICSLSKPRNPLRYPRASQASSRSLSPCSVSQNHLPLPEQAAGETTGSPSSSLPPAQTESSLELKSNTNPPMWCQGSWKHEQTVHNLFGVTYAITGSELLYLERIQQLLTDRKPRIGQPDLRWVTVFACSQPGAGPKHPPSKQLRGHAPTCHTHH